MPGEPALDLLRRFVDGDRDAFESLFRQYESEVYRWILRIVRDPTAAEDALVDAFWRAYRARARFDWSRSFGAWMRRIATNAAYDALRSARRAAWTPMPDKVAIAKAPDAGIGESIELAFRRLPPRLRIVATLALVEELPHADIADALDV